MSATMVVASAASVMASVVTTSLTGVAATGSAVASSAPATLPLESIVTSVVPSIVASVLPAGVTTTTPVTSTQLLLPVPFEVLAIFAGSLAGGMTAVDRRFDVIGVMTLAIVTGLGGGIIRDVLLQDYGIFALDTPRALIAVVIAAAIATFFLAAAQRLRPVLLLIDAMSLALFCLVGSDKALVAGLTVVPAILLGTITAVGGGILRDMLSGHQPEVLRRGSLYSTAAVAGCTVYVALVTWLNIEKPIAMVVAALLAVILRMGSVWFGWESPEPVDLTHQVARIPGRAWQAGSGLLRARRHDRRDAEAKHAIEREDDNGAP